MASDIPELRRLPMHKRDLKKRIAEYWVPAEPNANNFERLKCSLCNGENATGGLQLSRAISKMHAHLAVQCPVLEASEDPEDKEFLVELRRACPVSACPTKAAKRLVGDYQPADVDGGNGHVSDGEDAPGTASKSALKKRKRHAAGKATYRPQTHLRQAAIRPGQTALLFIDTQKYNCSVEGAMYRAMSPEQLADSAYFWDNITDVTINWGKLQDTCRTHRVEVMYTVIQSLTRDGRDMSLDYKISGFHVPPGSSDAEVLDEIRPREDEIVIPKTSCNVFLSTNIDYVLRCLGVRDLILCGCVTDQCVNAAVRSACDLGYKVTMVTDACIAKTKAQHDAAVNALRGYCRQMGTEDLSSELMIARQW